jgi:immunoglobulin-like protein involved in spore germination
MVARDPLTCHCEERMSRRHLHLTQVQASNLLLVILTIFLCGCSSASPSPTPGPVTQATRTPQPLPTESPTAVPDYVLEIRNAEYQLGATDALRLVQLTDGIFEQGTPGGEDYVSVNVTDFVATGDLNGDGVKEIAALIAENYGGTGVFTFLVIFDDVGGKPVFRASIIVDDRPQLNALSIENEEIFLDATIHAADDPFCCPTLRTTRHYRLAPTNQLDLIDYTTFTPAGQPRTITIEVPLDGAEIYSSVQFRGRVAIAPFENNLVYRIYDISGIELAAGAMPVSARELGGPGTFNMVIAVGNVLSGAVIRIEIQDISAADGSLFAMDSVELVVK